LTKIATGQYYEPSYAVAVIHYELDKEMYGLIVPAVTTAVDEFREKLGVTTQTFEQLQETIVSKIIERIEKKVPSLLTNAPPEKLREAQ
jgi:hypothetical protein